MTIGQKRPFVVLSLSILLTLSLAAQAGVLNPPTAPTTGTMKTLDEVQPRIPIPGSSTATGQFVINQSGSYYLTGNRLSSSHGIYISAQNVTIDLCGYSLVGSDTGYGLYLNNAVNVEIRNGTIRNFQYGMIYSGTAPSSCRILGVRVFDCSDLGIFLPGNNHQIIGCTVSGCGNHGILSGSSCRIEGNSVYENGGAGISVSASCVIKDNTVYSNDSYGIFATNACAIKTNTVHGNGNDGIYVYDGCIIMNNTAYENTGNGIYTGPSAVVKNNNAYENNESGIHVGGYASSVVGNTARNNQQYGIYVIRYCLVDQNATYGNNQSGESYVNLKIDSYCVVGLNVAP